MPKAECVELDARLALLVDAFVPDPAAHIFNTPEFFRLHSGNGEQGHYFQLADRDNGSVLACVHFTQTEPGCHRSPARGTFGGISCVSGLAPDRLEQFLLAVQDWLRQRGAREIRILLPPFSHDPPLVSASFNILSRMGYAVSQQELNHDLAVNDTPLPERMDYGNRKRHNKCLREGIVTSLLPAQRYREAYEVIAGNRRRKGFPVTMAFDDIMTMVDTFPDRMLFFGADKAGVLAAASVCIVLSARILYVFYWGDAEGMHDHSPVVPLAAAIYAHCQQKGFDIMDTGISTSGGEPNHGLIRFKRSLGMRESLKLGLTWSMASHA